LWAVHPLRAQAVTETENCKRPGEDGDKTRGMG